MGEPNQVKWRGIRPIEPHEDLPIDLHAVAGTSQSAGDWTQILTDIKASGRFKTYTSSLSSYSLGPSSSYTWLSVSGAGRVFYMAHRSDGIPSIKAAHRINPDGSGTFSEPYWIDVMLAGYRGFTTRGNYNAGRSYVFIDAWDITNNVYIVDQRFLEILFAESFSAVIVNEHTTSTATVWAKLTYVLQTASLALKFRLKDRAMIDPIQLRNRINSEIWPCEAVIRDHFIENPQDPEENWRTPPRLQIILREGVSQERIQRLKKELYRTDLIIGDL